MKSVFEYWPEIAAQIHARGSIFLALDYDGVLSPIAAQPDLAMLSAANRGLLENVVKCPGVKVAIISGRSLADVRKHVAVPEIIYAGNHGAEIEMNGFPESHIALAGYREELIEVRKQLAAAFAGCRGVFLEDKGFGIGLHYREVDPIEIAAFHDRFGGWAKQLPSTLQIIHAKKMYEVRPKVSWNKGNAVWHIWQSLAPEALPICLGDDLTDEDGFRALLGKGINIYVGEERQSYAEYILPLQSDVTTFLTRIWEEARGFPQFVEARERI